MCTGKEELMKTPEDLVDTPEMISEESPTFVEENMNIVEEKKAELPEIILPEPKSAFFNDISVFGFSQQGESHVRKNAACQDRSDFRVIQEKLLIAAVADGVGSCVLSDYGAETAVNASLDYIEQYLSVELKQENFVFDNPEKMGKALREMMHFALTSVEKRAEEMEQLLYSFQSTLTVAVYDGRTLYFAHAGDDGIIVQNQSGTYAMVTARHKGEEASSVYPLQSVQTWQFGKVEDTVGFVMATDGVLDAFVRPEAEKNRVYYPFIEPVFYSEQKNEEDAAAVCGDWYEYMKSSSYRESVTDDLSFIGVVNQKTVQDSTKPKFDIDAWNQQTREYIEKRKAALYPSKTLKKQDTTENLESTSQEEDHEHKPKEDVETRKYGEFFQDHMKQMENQDPSEIARQAKLAAQKMGEGFLEMASISAVIFMDGVERTSGYINETIERRKKKNHKKQSDLGHDKNQEDNLK